MRIGSKSPRIPNLRELFQLNHLAMTHFSARPASPFVNKLRYDSARPVVSFCLSGCFSWPPDVVAVSSTFDLDFTDLHWHIGQRFEALSSMMMSALRSLEYKRASFGSVSYVFSWEATTSAHHHWTKT